MESRFERVKPFNEKGNQELINYLKSIDFYAAPGDWLVCTRLLMYGKKIFREC